MQNWTVEYIGHFATYQRSASKSRNKLLCAVFVSTTDQSIEIM
jgi:hypothetical protein